MLKLALATFWVTFGNNFVYFSFQHLVTLVAKSKLVKRNREKYE